MAMHRRRFLQSSLAAAPLMLGEMPFALPTSRLFDVLGGAPTDRVLVLINLVGGNDGLNTVVPLDQYDTLARVRSNVLLPQNRLLGLDDVSALHPALGGFREVWDAGKLGVVRGVGYPDQNGSHFRSSDIWNSGSSATELVTTGWLGRRFERQYPGFPTGYPNAEATDPVAISLGGGASETCQGVVANFSVAVRDPHNAISVFEAVDATVPDNTYGRQLEFLRVSAEQTNAYSDAVKTKVNRGRNAVSYPADNRLARQLSYVAKMIAGGLETKVYVATVDGFDTHADQIVDGDPTQGEHAELLRQLGDAVAAFQADLTALGLQERVFGMTYSEFGRRIRSNDALGTDHGAAAPMFLFGSCVNAGFLGQSPTIDPGVGVQEGVAMQYDFRDVYGSVLEDWFSLDASEVRRLLHDDYVRLPIIRNCDASAVTAPEPGLADFAVAPVPFGDHTRVSFEVVRSERIQLEVYDAVGKRVEVLFSRKLPAGSQELNVDTSGYPTGAIMFRLRAGSDVRVVRGMKL